MNVTQHRSGLSCPRKMVLYARVSALCGIAFKQVWSVLLYRLTKLLEQVMDGSKVLIFLETKRGCDQVTRQLRQDGWPALSIHGDKSQAERDWVLAEFKAGKSPIMTATDVAARGLGEVSSCMAVFLCFFAVSCVYCGLSCAARLYGLM